MDQSSSWKRECDYNDIPTNVKLDYAASSVDIMPRKRGRPRKEISSTDENGNSMNPPNTNAKKTSRPRKQNQASSPVNQGRFKSTKFFTDNLSNGMKS